MPNDTRTALSQNAGRWDSRSLFFDRFAEPEAKDNDRKDWFKKACEKQALKVRAAAWQNVLPLIAPGRAVVLYAQLQSRLMVNMAGGVMENAGLCLDRFGLPFIPGTAVKGSARRMATQQLVEAEAVEAKADLLFEICLVFGWGNTDWDEGRKRKRENGRDVETEPRSDFWWAMAPDTGNRQLDDGRRNAMWRHVAVSTANRLLYHLHIAKREHPNEPWRDLPNFAGSVSFLAAYPVDLGKTGKVDALPLEAPTLGKLELDIVTCHHREYYEKRLPTATDTEEPNPVVFPAVAPGHVFAFGVVQLRSTSVKLLGNARSWLQTGLETLGLGAKTNAGYGWFVASSAVQAAVERELKATVLRVQQEKERREEDARRKAEEDTRIRKAAELKAATANLTPEQKADYELEQLSEVQFRGRLDLFHKREQAEQEAMVRAMRLPADHPGSRRRFWDDLKAKAQGGGKPAQIESSVRQLSKQMYPGKEGKMP